MHTKKNKKKCIEILFTISRNMFLIFYMIYLIIHSFIHDLLLISEYVSMQWKPIVIYTYICVIYTYTCVYVYSWSRIPFPTPHNFSSNPLIIPLLTPHIFTVVRMTAHIHLLQKNKRKTYMVYLKIIARFQMKFTPWQKKQSQKIW
jgi:hypothetical protein